MIKGTFPIERFQNIETPFYYYDTRVLRETLDTIREELRHNPEYEMHYAIKANANPKILRIISAAGFGADCVSGGEVRAAIEAGFPASKVVFAGVGKSDREIDLALRHSIACFNVESLEELQVINERAASLGTIAPVAFRINPNVDACTHAKITTGLSENKFGIDLGDTERAIRTAHSLAHIRYEGLHFHIGSQILTDAPFRRLCHRINELQERLERQGIHTPGINVGGGLGISYEHPDDESIPRFEPYFDTFRRHLALRPGQQLHFELGRSVVGQCGTLIARVLYVKQGTTRRFLILDAGMTELVRPAMYGARHAVQRIALPTDAAPAADAPRCTYDVVGRLRQRPTPAPLPARRPHRHPLRRSLWRKHGLHLQPAPPAPHHRAVSEPEQPVKSKNPTQRAPHARSYFLSKTPKHPRAAPPVPKEKQLSGAS